MLLKHSVSPPSSYSILQSDPQPTQAANEQAGAQGDLANLAVVVDEMEGTTSESSAPRDSDAVVVARFFRLKPGFRY